MVRAWDLETGEAIEFGGNNDVVLSIQSSHYSNNLASDVCNIILCIEDAKTGPFQTPSGFLEWDLLCESGYIVWI